MTTYLYYVEVNGIRVMQGTPRLQNAIDLARCICLGYGDVVQVIDDNADKVEIKYTRIGGQNEN